MSYKYFISNVSISKTISISEFDFNETAYCLEQFKIRVRSNLRHSIDTPLIFFFCASLSAHTKYATIENYIIHTRFPDMNENGLKKGRCQSTCETYTNRSLSTVRCFVYHFVLYIYMYVCMPTA
jgi:hypothetical protein